jgi:hypothetical protein
MVQNQNTSVKHGNSNTETWNVVSNVFCDSPFSARRFLIHPICEFNRLDVEVRIAIVKTQAIHVDCKSNRAYWWLIFFHRMPVDTRNSVAAGQCSASTCRTWSNDSWSNVYIAVIMWAIHVRDSTSVTPVRICAELTPMGSVKRRDGSYRL